MLLARENHQSPTTLGHPDNPGNAGAAPCVKQGPRPRVAGKFLFVGDEKFYVRGVTYGPFRPEADGSEYHDWASVERDFAAMEANGINAVRVYTVPPKWVLDMAWKHRLRVLVGLPWEQHITFLDDSRRRRDVEQRLRMAVRSCARHPGLLGFAIGNEIPSPIVRWYGHRRIEKFLERLYWSVKEEDSEALVTYVNYPSTEYLELPFLDFVAYNVYLETQEKLEAYVARLQNLAGERPLMIAELGLDSLRKGLALQAQTLEWQVRTLLSDGCAGLFVFAWTDEWHRGGHDIEDWDFGLTTRSRAPKPALESVRDALRDVPFPTDESWPLISVVICSYNGSRTIRQALEALGRIRYPNFEVIVVDDGSRDATAAIVGEYQVHLIRQANAGLSAARNVGWRAARGEIVAYLDDDAAPDPHWLHYLASAFLGGEYAGVGGPNIAFPEDNFVARCVDHAPGNPTHVLLTDRVAEHLPGCNMAYRRACLEAIGGFDAQFRIAGDDVDLCWRLQQYGWRLGFHPGAMVWHHRRNSVRTYWRQQLNYGRAEAMLEQKWPEKYNAAGHVAWNGRLYNKGFWHLLRWSRRRIYHGSWGSALFQSVYEVAPGKLSTLLMMPEWYLLMAVMGLLSLAGLCYAPLRFCSVFLVLAFLPPALQSWRSGWHSCFGLPPGRHVERVRLSAMTALLHFLQPAARLAGRLRQGLTPWRRRGVDRVVLPRAASVGIWSEKKWRGAEQRLAALAKAMRESGAVVVRGGDYDAWDLEARGGVLGTARTTLVIEEHGDGRQLARFRVWPVFLPSILVVVSLIALLAFTAAINLDWAAWAVLNIPAVTLFARMVYEAGAAQAVILRAISASLGEQEQILEGAKIK